MKPQISFIIVLLVGLVFHNWQYAAGQTSQPSPTPNPRYTEAEVAFSEAAALYAKHTTESMEAAVTLTEKARRLFNETKAPMDEAMSLLLLGHINKDLGNKRIALKNCQEALLILQKEKEKDFEASTLSRIGALYEELDDPQKALEAYNQALLLYRELGDKKGEAAMLRLIAGVSKVLGDTRKTLQYLQEALPLYEALGDKDGTATVLNNIGTMYENLGEKKNALEYFNRALPLMKEVGDKTAEATTLFNLGAVSASLGETERAQEYYSQSLSLFKSLNDHGGTAAVFSNLGKGFLESGQEQKALEYFNQALVLFRTIGDKGKEAITQLQIGMSHEHIGENQKALEHYNEAVLLYKELRHERGEAVSLNRIGKVYDALGQRSKALDYFNAALPLRRAAGDKDGEAQTLNNLGEVYDSLGDRQKALSYFSLALSLRRAIQDRKGELRTIINIGELYDTLGERQKALEYLNQASSLSNAIGDKDGDATVLNNIGRVYGALGEQQKALDYLNKALELNKALHDKQGEAITLNNIGMVYVDLGEKQKALEYTTQALQLYRTIGEKKLEASMLGNIGISYFQLHEQQKALEYANQALRLSREIGDKEGEGRGLSNLGAMYLDLEEPQKGLEYLKQALPLRKAVGDKLGEASTLFNIARSYYESNEPQKALEYLPQALLLESAAGSRPREAMTLTSMAAVWNALNKRPLAIFFAKQAVNHYQQLRSAIRGIERQNQQSFLHSVENPFRQLAGMLLEEGRLTEAHQVFNLFKDQEFFDATRSGDTSISPARDTELTPREKEAGVLFQRAMTRLASINQPLLDLEFSLKNHQPTADEERQLEQLKAQLLTANTEAFAALQQIEAIFTQPAANQDKITMTSDTVEMQTALRELKERTNSPAVALYTLGEAGKLYVLIVTPDQLIPVSTKVSTLNFIGGIIGNRKAAQDGLWLLLQSPGYDPRPQAQDIYNIVFKPIEPQIKRVEAEARKENPNATVTLMWSLDWFLRYIPMASLYDGERYLAERYLNVVFTRANKERMTRPVSPNWTGIGFGSTKAQTVTIFGEEKSYEPLPGAERELATVFGTRQRPGTMPGQTLLNERFTKDTFLAALKERKPVAHVASHFTFEPGDETRSFLLLGSGEMMTLAEMKTHEGLFTGLELLTLSACNTGAQQSGAQGREIDGFAELAQRLGAGAVLATLWPVSDASTPGLMGEFYKRRQEKPGRTKAAALQQAQLALLNGKIHSSASPVVGEKSLVKQKSGRANIVGVKEEPVNSPRYPPNPKARFAHPYYWSGFILIGNLL